jgi:hypothetical protein
MGFLRAPSGHLRSESISQERIRTSCKNAFSEFFALV